MSFYRTAKGNPIMVASQQVLRVVPLDEARQAGYDDMADLAVIFHHLIVETPGCDASQIIWRWHANNLMCWLHEHAPFYSPSSATSQADGQMPFQRGCLEIRGSININDLFIDLHRGQFSMQEYMKFYMQIGYSLCGFSEVFGQGEAAEFDLPDAKQPQKDPRRYTETVIDYMRRIYAGQVLSL